MTSERTALVCWGPKGFTEMKMALYKGNQAGECLTTHTHTHTYAFYMRNFFVPTYRPWTEWRNRDHPPLFPLLGKCCTGPASQQRDFVDLQLASDTSWLRTCSRRVSNNEGHASPEQEGRHPTHLICSVVLLNAKFKRIMRVICHCLHYCIVPASLLVVMGSTGARLRSSRLRVMRVLIPVDTAILAMRAIRQLIWPPVVSRQVAALPVLRVLAGN